MNRKIFFFGPSASGKKTTMFHIANPFKDMEYRNRLGIRRWDAVIPYLIPNTCRTNERLEIYHWFMSQKYHGLFHGQNIDLYKTIPKYVELYGNLPEAVYIDLNEDEFYKRAQSRGKKYSYQRAYSKRSDDLKQLKKYFNTIYLWRN